MGPSRGLVQTDKCLTCLVLIYEFIMLHALSLWFRLESNNPTSISIDLKTGELLFAS